MMMFFKKIAYSECSLLLLLPVSKIIDTGCYRILCEICKSYTKRNSKNRAKSFLLMHKEPIQFNQ